MPRYFFHTQDGKTITDEEGLELSDSAAARTEAVRLLGEILREGPDEFWQTEHLALTVTDHEGLTLFVLTASALRAPAMPGGRPSGRGAAP
jgi:hypothetical protein